MKKFLFPLMSIVLLTSCTFSLETGHPDKKIYPPGAVTIDVSSEYSGAIAPDTGNQSTGSSLLRMPPQ